MWRLSAPYLLLCHLSPGLLYFCVRQQESTCLDPQAHRLIESRGWEVLQDFKYKSRQFSVCVMSVLSCLVKQEPRNLRNIMPECNKFMTPLYKDYI